MVEKVDFKKELAQLYAPKNKDWELIDVPVMSFLMVDGAGDPIRRGTIAMLWRRSMPSPTPSNS
jgi:hypothetical protein